jgi:hypothetical protein
MFRLMLCPATTCTFVSSNLNLYAGIAIHSKAQHTNLAIGLESFKPRVRRQLSFFRVGPLSANSISSLLLLTTFRLERMLKHQSSAFCVSILHLEVTNNAAYRSIGYTCPPLNISKLVNSHHGFFHILYANHAHNGCRYRYSLPSCSPILSMASTEAHSGHSIQP